MKRLSVLFILLIVFYALPSAAQAADDGCKCFCSSTEGAYQYSEDEVADILTCQDLCDDYLGCYADNPNTDDEDESLTLQPKYNTMCWQKYECIESEEGEVSGEWAGQHPSCIPNEGHCYSEAIPVTLNIAIGSLTEATSLGEYINAGYSFALAAGSLLAIVMIMLGGIQYMLARGKPEAIGKAKSRITGAITGIVLLFASYTIANVVDPSFATFNRVAPPRIRTVVFLDPDSTCDAMDEAGMTIIPSTGACGDPGIVTDLGATETGIVIGDECVYSGCSDDLSVCVGSVEAESGYECQRCYQVAERGAYTGSETWGLSDLPPSDSQCSRMTPVDNFPDDNLRYYCLYNEDANSECVEVSYPGGEAGVDCDRLIDDARAADSEGCRAYDLLEIGIFDLELLGSGVDYVDIDEFRNDDYEYEVLQKFCTEDVCELAPDGEGCVISVVEYSDVPMTILPSLSIGADDLWVNCTNTSSETGMSNCLDKDGGEADCQWNW
ncbi:hypothetical protein HN358_01840 [Candidatus Uhrbacteria bacterium]|nr:hypothetical protein [Candidatus Uhrbacteria bacterium]MBT7716848.1 hypothetical protein [Candidatus Uhrbacteria bacterium]